MPPSPSPPLLGADAGRTFVLGCGPIGGYGAAMSDAVARATIDEAWERGVRAFDTAPFYGSGLAERRLGEALAGRPRAGCVISTKVGRLLVPRVGAPRGGADAFAGGPPLDPVRDYSRDGVLYALGASLGRLGCDRVDLVHVHDPDDPADLDRAIAEAIPTLVDLREQGVIGAVSAGMNAVAPLVRIVRESDVDLVMVAGRCTLLDASATATLLPVCRARGVGVLAAAVYNAGVLVDPREGAHFNYAPATAAVLARARRIAVVCARHDTTVAAAAQAYARRLEGVVAVVVGARSPAEVAGSVVAHDAVVPAALWDDLAAEGLLPA